MIFLFLTLMAVITVVKEINKETNMPYKLTDVISRLNIYSRIIFIIVLNTFVNFLVFK